MAPRLIQPKPVESPPKASPNAEESGPHKLSRIGGPKVRTGCVTCKKRHIKCDETKPACIKCLSSTGACGGYWIKPRKNRSRKQPMATPGTFIKSGALKRADPTVGPKVGVAFEDELQKMYFEEWLYLAESQLAGYSPNKLWSTFLPQLTGQSVALRDAALGIGAMSQALLNPSGPEIRHYDNAIIYYCRALRTISQSNHSGMSLQDAMLLSILFTTFEGLRHDLKSALRHISHGLLILRELCLGDRADSLLMNLAPSPGELINEIILLYTRFVTQTQTVMTGTIKERNLHSRSAEIDYGTQMDEREQLCERLTPYMTPRAGLNWQPEVFDNADTAAEYWHATNRRIERLDTSAVQLIDDVLNQDPRDYKNAEKYLQRLRNSPQMQSFTSNVKTRLQSWQKAFLPLYQRTLTNSPSKDPSYIRLVSLRIDYLALSIYSMFSEACDYDYVSSITPECRELTELCEILLRKRYMDFKGPASSFSMHTGLSWHLVFVAINCRDPITRETAIRVLETYPRQDGLWSSRAFVEIAKKNRITETQNCDEGTPQEQWQRLNRRAFLLEDAGDTLIFRYVRKESDAGRWEYVEEYADLKSLTKETEVLQWRERPLSCDGCTLQWGRTADTSSGPLWPGMACSIPTIR